MTKQKLAQARWTCPLCKERHVATHFTHCIDCGHKLCDVCAGDNHYGRFHDNQEEVEA